MTAFFAMVRYTLTVTVTGGRRRLLGAMVVGAVALGLLGRLADDPADGAAAVIGGGFLGLIVPLACLVVGDAALAAERRSGALAFTWLAPVPFRDIVVARWVGASILAAGSMAGAAALAAATAGAGDHAGVAALSVAVASMTYVAVFILIGATTRRAALWSLGWVFIVDQMLGAVLSGVAQLSPSWLGRQVYVDLAHLPADDIYDALPLGWGAVVQLAVLAAVALALARWRLAHLRP